MSTADLVSAPPGAGSARAAVWMAAAAAALATHAGAVAWALRQPPILPMDAAAPAAVMIELAPAPTAPEEVEEEQIAPDAFEAPEIVSQTPDAPLEPVPPETPPELAMAEPDVPLPEPTPVETPVVEETLPEMEPLPELPAEVVEPRPVARPRDLEVAKAEPVREPEPEREPKRVAPAKAAVEAKVNAPKAETAAAPTNARGSTGGQTPARWQSRLMAHLERHKRYPAGARKRGEEGVAHVRFSIDDNGNVRSAQLVRSSGYAELDEAVVGLVRRASPVPAPPPGAPHEITAPVRFNIR